MTDPVVATVAFARRHTGAIAAWTLVWSIVAFGFPHVLGAIFSVQPYVSAALGFVIVLYIVHRLLCCAEQYNTVERFGMGMTAAGMVMATPALWMPDTPFDGWSFNVARVGIAIYIVTGGLRRDRHRSRNLAQAAYWEGVQDGRARKARP